MNSTFCARWLASSEVISQVLFTSEQPKKKKAFVGILPEIKVLFGPLIFQLHLCGIYWNNYLPQCRWKWWIFTSTSGNNNMIAEWCTMLMYNLPERIFSLPMPYNLLTRKPAKKLHWLQQNNCKRGVTSENVCPWNIKILSWKWNSRIRS